jgi:DNA-binding PucR family transcriptional regulator
VTLTVKTLVEDVGLELAAGRDAADTQVRWVHSTELLDPTPWLSGGEVVLTTGLQLERPVDQRQYVRRLADHQLSGLGFGSGFGHDRIPHALLAEAEKLDFPLFEVPYEVPFIAITEKAFGRLLNEQYQVLQRGLAIHKRLEQLVLEERGLEEVARALANAIGGAIVVLGSRAETMTATGFRRRLPKAALESVRAEIADRIAAGKAVAFAPDHPSVSGRALALPVAERGPEGPQAWLIAVRDSGGLAESERLILQQAVTVVALELMRRRVVRDTERRLAGDVLKEAVSGALDESELETRLRPFKVGSRAAVLVFEVGDPAAGESVLDRTLSDLGTGSLVGVADGLLCAIVDASEREPLELAEQVRGVLEKRFGDIRAAASRPAPATSLRRSFHEARCALEVVSRSNGHASEVASYRDLGAFQFLLSVQDDDALRMYCEGVLGPIENGEGEYGDELLRSLEAFLEHNGQWERAARQLFCHRHTLRYRIRKVEELTGRDLSRAQDRIEFWLALRAREMVG